MKHTALVHLPERTSYKSGITHTIPSKLAEVVLEIDLQVLIQLMSERAQCTKKGESTLCDGLIKCTISTIQDEI